MHVNNDPLQCYAESFGRLEQTGPGTWILIKFLDVLPIDPFDVYQTGPSP
jgi:hypothetical protein